MTVWLAVFYVHNDVMYIYYIYTPYVMRIG